jgi:hypothetical protein
MSDTQSLCACAVITFSKDGKDHNFHVLSSEAVANICFLGWNFALIMSTKRLRCNHCIMQSMWM